MGKIKGAAFRELIGWFVQTKGDEAVRAAVVSLSVDHQRELDLGSAELGVLASRWYEAELVHRLLDALVAGVPEQERRKLAEEASSAVMERTLRGIYRLLFQWMATPQRYARYAGKLWSSYYDSGVLRITMPDRHTAVSRIQNWDAHHPFICELNLGAALAIYGQMGCRDVRSERELCVGHGEPECRFVTRWS